MNILETINAIVVSLGIPVIIGSAIYLGKKLQIIDAHDTDVSSLKTDVLKIRELLAKIVSYICTKDNRINPNIFSSNSPLNITKKGKEILEKSGGKEFVDENLDYLFKKIDEQHPATNFDIQQQAIDAIVLEFGNEKFKKIKEYAYQNPVMDNDPNKPLTLFDISKAMGIYLRDKYLEKHSELK